MARISRQYAFFQIGGSSATLAAFTVYRMANRRQYTAEQARNLVLEGFSDSEDEARDPDETLSDGENIDFDSESENNDFDPMNDDHFDSDTSDDNNVEMVATDASSDSEAVKSVVIGLQGGDEKPIIIVTHAGTNLLSILPPASIPTTHR